MRLHAIRLTNFRQHADTSITFDGGITGIIGPNGTGKTTILEAIAWALYGNDAARGRRETIRFARADAKAPVRVELEFELAGHQYRVVRGLSSAELYLDRSEQPIANSITSVGELLQRRLGMSRTEFFSTYFTGQKELSVMTALGPTERGQFLSRVLGYERLRTAQDLARDKRREILAELNGLRGAMADPGEVERVLTEADTRFTDASRRAADAARAKEHAHAALAAVLPRWEAAQQARAVRQQAIGDLRVAEREHAERVRDLDRATRGVDEAAAAGAELGALAPQLAPLAALVTEREALDVLAREEGRRQTLTDAIRDAEEELKRLTERRAHLEEAPQLEEEITVALETKRNAVRAADAALEAARTEWVRDRQEAETKRDALRRQYAEVKAQRDLIVEAGEDGTCPTCQRPLGTHFRAVLDILDAQLDAVRVDGNYYKGRLEQLQAVPAAVGALEDQRRALADERTALERRVATVQASAQELAEVRRTVARHEQRLAGLRADLAILPTGYDAARHAVVRRELERLSPLEQRAARLTVAAERAEAARVELTAARAAHDASAARVSAMRAAIGDSDGDAAFDAVRLAHEGAGAAAREAAIAQARAEAEMAGAVEARDRATALREELARAEARLAALTRERRLHDELDHTFTDLRTDLNFALRPELAGLASEFLADLTDGRYTELDLDDAYNLVIVEDGTPKPVISGGEEDLANLVLRLAISQMIAERVGQSFSLLILDEVFGSLDEARRQNVVQLMRRLRDRFEQVILITHIESVRDGCDRVLTVRYDAASGAAVVASAGEPIVTAADVAAVAS